MKPQPGDIVLYHFEAKLAFTGGGGRDAAHEVRSRPAIVQSTNQEDRVNLRVMYEDVDLIDHTVFCRTVPVLSGGMYATLRHGHPGNRASVDAHRDSPTSEIGIVGVNRPSDNTWSWPGNRTPRRS